MFSNCSLGKQLSISILKLLVALICLMPLGHALENSTSPDNKVLSHQESTSIVTGAAQFDRYLPLLKGKRVGLITNQTALVNGHHLVDILISKRINVVKLFAPEHGIRGDHDAGERVSNGVDDKTGLPIVSLYGKTKRPTPSMLADLDILVFDIQDVGVRFYTYINTLFYSMQAAQKSGLPFVILDRPNPHISIVDGPMLEAEFRSFVGLLPIPMVHGMTVGELGLMISGEEWLNTIEPYETIESREVDESKQALTNNKPEPQGIVLTVIPVKNYDRSQRYQLPIAPSPNLPNMRAINLYPSLCLFEATPISIGRGTEWPFQVIGHDKVSLGSFKFTPESMPGKSKYPKLEGKLLTGQNLANHKLAEVGGLDLQFIIQWHALFSKHELPFFTRPSFFDKLAGTDSLRKAITNGQSESSIRQGWQADLDKFKRLRQPYLIYK